MRHRACFHPGQRLLALVTCWLPPALHSLLLGARGWPPLLHYGIILNGKTGGNSGKEQCYAVDGGWGKLLRYSDYFVPFFRGGEVLLLLCNTEPWALVAWLCIPACTEKGGLWFLGYQTLIVSVSFWAAPAAQHFVRSGTRMGWYMSTGRFKYLQKIFIYSIPGQDFSYKKPKILNSLVCMSLLRTYQKPDKSVQKFITDPRLRTKINQRCLLNLKVINP